MNKKIVTIFCIMMSFTLLVGCGDVVEETGAKVNQESSIEENQLLYITEMDMNTEMSEPIYVDMDEIPDKLVIQSGGEYVLSGSTHKTIQVDAHDEIVHLFLENLTVETAEGPAIGVTSAGKVIITLVEGSSNALFDAAYYDDEDVVGAIATECDLTINGTGSLYACGYSKDAIYSKDVIKILGGTFQLRSKRNGIRGNDGLVLQPTYLGIESEKNGCQTVNADKEDKGVIHVLGGEISIIAGEYGMSAASDLYVQDGTMQFNSIQGNLYTEGQLFLPE